MTLRADLLAARDRIADRANWCQGTEALARDGTQVSAPSDLACRWDALGACRALPRGEADRDARIFAAERHLQAAAQEMFGRPVAQVNDGDGAVLPVASHMMVLLVFDRAITRAAHPVTG